MPQLFCCTVLIYPITKRGVKQEALDPFHAQAPTLIERVFGGRLASAIACAECGYESISSEPFFELSLPLPEHWTSLPTQKQRRQQQHVGIRCSHATWATCQVCPLRQLGAVAVAADAEAAAAVTAATSRCRATNVL